MAIDCKQLKNEIIIPSLTAIELVSDVAVNLLLGTAAQESAMGQYIKQIRGPALGIFQMEPETFYLLWYNKIGGKYKNNIMTFLNYHTQPTPETMIYDLRFAAIMCRLKYLSVTAPLPINELSHLASYWKTYYNTSMGRGTEYEFIANYRRYVTC